MTKYLYLHILGSFDHILRPWQAQAAACLIISFSTKIREKWSTAAFELAGSETRIVLFPLF